MPKTGHPRAAQMYDGRMQIRDNETLQGAIAMLAAGGLFFVLQRPGHHVWQDARMGASFAFLFCGLQFLWLYRKSSLLDDN